MFFMIEIFSSETELKIIDHVSIINHKFLVHFFTLNDDETGLLPCLVSNSLNFLIHRIIVFMDYEEFDFNPKLKMIIWSIFFLFQFSHFKCISMFLAFPSNLSLRKMWVNKLWFFRRISIAFLVSSALIFVCLCMNKCVCCKRRVNMIILFCIIIKNLDWRNHKCLHRFSFMLYTYS